MKCILFFFLLILIGETNGQNCSYKIGDEYSLKQAGVNIRATPSRNSKIITKINSSWNYVGLVILNDKIQNNFINVKISVEDFEQTRDIASLNGKVGWIDTSLIEYGDPIELYFDNEYKKQIEFYSKMIEIMNERKSQNDCKYSANSLSEYYTWRGSLKYIMENDYSSAIEDFTIAIFISSPFPNILESYLYRGYAKENLGDYKGAVNDFNYVINNLDKVERWYSGHSCKTYIIGREEFCKEDLIRKKDVCQSKIGG